MSMSKDTVKLLRWLRGQDRWMYESEIQKAFSNFDYRSFRTLVIDKYIDGAVFEDEFPEYDEYGNVIYPKQYRINDKGIAYLEELPRRWVLELREWIAIGISVAALLISITALLAQLGLIPIG